MQKKRQQNPKLGSNRVGLHNAVEEAIRNNQKVHSQLVELRQKVEDAVFEGHHTPSILELLDEVEQQRETSIIQEQRETSTLQQQRETSTLQEQRETSTIQQQGETSTIQQSSPTEEYYEILRQIKLVQSSKRVKFITLRPRDVNIKIDAEAPVHIETKVGDTENNSSSGVTPFFNITNNNGNSTAEVKSIESTTIPHTCCDTHLLKEQLEFIKKGADFLSRNSDAMLQNMAQLRNSTTSTKCCGNLRDENIQLNKKIEELLKQIRRFVPDRQIKAFTATEVSRKIEELQQQNSNAIPTHRNETLAKTDVITNPSQEEKPVLPEKEKEFLRRNSNYDPLLAEKQEFIMKGAEFLRRAWGKYKAKKHQHFAV
ncbi:hypothetical protein CEXT_358831 [Caerostris extrusa]|uniref:Uncharacterized protein n=1 Tax=Caerostris extrusa TaxID=172846 RepID=A0AAV4SRG5_CAEEX|nr:hypothetical protein CEXT_358831 [Caerostris extrusa]